MLYFTEPDDIQALIDEFALLKILWLDTEVADFKSQKPRLSLIQMLAYPQDKDGSRTFIIDVLNKRDEVDYFIEKIMSNEQINKVFHNAQHDLKFLGGKKAQNITCTMKLAQSIPYHILPVSSLTLKTLTEHLTEFKNVSKEEQGSDWGQRPLSDQQLHYAKMDPIYLAHIHQKLLELIKKNNTDPTRDDLTEIGKRYQEIEPEWKILDSEINHLKERAKNAMKAQNKPENFAFKLSGSDRTTVKVDFAELAQLAVSQGLDLHFPITLDKSLQKQLGDLLNKLSIQEEKTTTWRLLSKGLEEETDD
ncbi:3'-5' exonuclease [Gloeothece verrucosa]|uniref:3'-5' exonuclease n=1 Tax=Gloeothece verrucosa (strain PCC 7822) TaxID=497965 RepID=E0UKH8_GLOV7|nr:3'-5' exonuclease [Gloeothece verrucosa]ADN17059.1 3'-5' exonuclease [Gloeothece verrucosa PCC 7822]